MHSAKLATSRVTVEQPHVARPRTGLIWPGALLAAAVGLHVAGLAALLQGELNFLFNDAENRLGRGADFFAVYGAGEQFLDGSSVYAPVEGGDTPYAYGFRYLPSVGFSFGAPLNLLPPWAAYWSWASFNEALLAVNVFLTLRFGPTASWKAAGAAMWLLFTPYYLELYMGQFSFLMASLLFWLGLCLQMGARQGLFATWTASLLVKANSLLLLPLAWRTGWTRAALAGIAFVALINVPYFVAVEGAWEAWSANFDFASEASAVPHAGNLGLSSVKTLMAEEDGSGVASGARAVGSIPVGLAILGLTLVATLLADSGQRVRLLAAWLCAYFLVFDEVWEHHYVMMLPALVLLTLYEPRMRPFALGAYILLALPTPYAWFQTSPSPAVDFKVVDPQAFWSGAEVYAYHLSKALPVFVLWAAMCVLLTHSAGGRWARRARLDPAELREAA